MLQGRTALDPRYIPRAGFVIKTWDATDAKVFINVCSVEAMNQGQDGTDFMDDYDVYEPYLEGLGGIVVSDKFYVDVDKRGEACRVVHCGIHPMVTLAMRGSRRFKMYVIDRILNVVPERLGSFAGISRDYKLPKMRSKGDLPSFLEWGGTSSPSLANGHHHGQSGGNEGRASEIVMHNGGAGADMKAKASRRIKDTPSEQGWTLEYVGSPVAHSVKICVTVPDAVVDGVKKDKCAIRARIRGSEVLVEAMDKKDQKETLLCSVETNVSLDTAPKTHKTSYIAEDALVILTLKIGSFQTPL